MTGEPHASGGLPQARFGTWGGRVHTTSVAGQGGAAVRVIPNDAVNDMEIAGGQGSSAFRREDDGHAGRHSRRADAAAGEIHAPLRKPARCEVAAAHEAAIFALSALAEARDDDIGRHIRRTQHLVRALAEELARHPDYAGQLTPPVIELLFKSAPLHDIGKIAIPDAILFKPGRLDADEFETMKTHARIGLQVIERAEKEFGGPIEFLRIAKEIVHGHHERWDGTGYPQGVAGEAIPLSARLMAVADVYDALISARVYKPGMSYEAAAEIIRAGSGSHFDPAVVAAFDAAEERLIRIARVFEDPAPTVRAAVERTVPVDTGGARLGTRAGALPGVPAGGDMACAA